MRIEMTKMTKEMGRELLAKNRHNRSTSLATVKVYLHSMNTGRWDWDNGETLKLDTDGNLIDGQHRLQAFINSDLQETNFLIIHGLDSNAMKTLDSGKKRSNTDFLKLEGIAYHNILANAIPKILLLDSKPMSVVVRGGSSCTTMLNSISVDEILNEYYSKSEQYDSWAKTCSTISRMYSAKGYRGMPGGTLLLFMHLCYTNGWDTILVKRYLESLSNPPINTSSDTVANSLIKFTKEEKGKLLAMKNMVAMIKGFNAFMEGTHLKKIIIRMEKGGVRGTSDVIMIPNVAPRIKDGALFSST